MRPRDAHRPPGMIVDRAGEAAGATARTATDVAAAQNSILNLKISIDLANQRATAYTSPGPAICRRHDVVMTAG
ncbi:hypothetical protein Prum_008090 [Phytohabitans rumicis]|uniref:Uncharacterized protein n=1 Tax=Phytohabitans rumicis TaxID=1076125 RepID=A0A6V8KZA0_9ACTN|nr:hypothetical protein Prum_008090 [Phytohabitans rumicis]